MYFNLCYDEYEYGPINIGYWSCEGYIRKEVGGTIKVWIDMAGMYDVEKLIQKKWLELLDEYNRNECEYDGANPKTVRRLVSYWQA